MVRVQRLAQSSFLLGTIDILVKKASALSKFEGILLAKFLALEEVIDAKSGCLPEESRAKTSIAPVAILTTCAMLRY